MAQGSIKIDIHAAMIDCPNTDQESIITMAAATPHSKQLIPPEIILRLIEVMVEADDEKLNRPTIICLGLTARLCWDFLKTQYPMQQRSATSSCFPTSLEQPFLDRYGMRRLAQALKKWIGPDYRQVSELFLDETIGCQIMFLRREVYGDVSEDDSIHPREKELAERLRHWKEFPFKIWPSNIPFHSPILKTLSNPYGMGMQWYPTAARELLNIIVSCKRYQQINILIRDFHPGYIPHEFYLSNFDSILWNWVRNRENKDTAELKKLKRQVRHSDNMFGRL
ncbi:hypothetical protein BCON_0113g00310 [Botryotinia convoluta]|uniref:Uncharacterized protein n=1 Tax=Botryotinia convoluta TaxID=54673 RepID=A0A4Z1HYB1_9HELO|nr:hypothetical protein BCON_0113g00310 [Botryotinia convoluta]